MSVFNFGGGGVLFVIIRLFMLAGCDIRIHSRFGQGKAISTPERLRKSFRCIGWNDPLRNNPAQRRKLTWAGEIGMQGTRRSAMGCEALNQFGKLHNVEYDINGRSTDVCYAAHQKLSWFQLEAFLAGLIQQFLPISGKNNMAKTFR